MRKLFQNFRKSESGATLVEYGVALLVAIIVGGGALVTLGGEVNENMTDTAGVCAFQADPAACAATP